MRASVLLLAACGIPDEKVLDLGTDFTCFGQTPPAGADDPITISGVLIDPISNMPVGGAGIDGVQPAVSGSPLFTFTANGDGSYSRVQPTGGSPLDVFLRITAPSFIDAVFYPARPIAHSIHDQLEMLTESDLQNLGGGHITLDTANRGQMLVVVEDCAGAPVAGATITTSPAGTTLYFNMGRLDPNAQATDGVGAGSGVALIANVQPGPVMVDASVNGMALHGHVVTATTNAVLEVEVQP